MHWVRGDLTRPDTLAELCRPFDTVHHLAAQLMADDDERFFQVSFDGTRNLVEALLGAGRPRRLVFASSISASGPAREGGTRTEADACAPVCPYGRSKRMAELYLEAMAPHLACTVVRLPLVYGPGSRGGLLAYFQMVEKGACVIGGRTKTVTLGYVGDIVRGLILAGDSAASAGATYFLGDSHPYEVREIITAIEAALGRRSLRIHIPFVAERTLTALRPDLPLVILRLPNILGEGQRQMGSVVSLIRRRIVAIPAARGSYQHLLRAGRGARAGPRRGTEPW